MHAAPGAPSPAPVTRNAVSSTAAAPVARNLKLENALLAARAKALELFEVLESKGDLLFSGHCMRACEACWHMCAAQGWCHGNCVNMSLSAVAASSHSHNIICGPAPGWLAVRCLARDLTC